MASNTPLPDDDARGGAQVLAADDSPQRASTPVVGIGASAGGLEAFMQFLAHVPEKTGLAYVFIQHLDPTHPSELTQLLAKSTHLPVQPAADGIAVQPDRVYVIPPSVSLTIAGGALHLAPRPESGAPHLPLDMFFRSLAQDGQARAIGVVLSGTGSDGSLGLAVIKAAGDRAERLWHGRGRTSEPRGGLLTSI